MDNQLVAVSVAKIYGWLNIILIEVPLPYRPPVFMRMDNPCSSNAQLVVVDAMKFWELWRRCINPIEHPIANANPKIWLHDKKIHLAEDGFSRGRDNPVPLANVAFQNGYVTVSDITRTIWLLAHGCKAFPVECDLPGEAMLQQLAGVPYTDNSTATTTSNHTNK